MKGLKCSKIFQKRIFILCLLSVVFSFFGVFLCSQDSSAASLPTDHFKLSYVPVGGSLQWSGNLYYGRNNGLTNTVDKFDGYRVHWFDITPTGNTASVHFETNIVISYSSLEYISFSGTALNTLQVSSCNVGTIQNSSVSYALTNWTGGGYENATLTIYGDFVITGLTQGVSTQFYCIVGSSQDFIYTSPPNTSVKPFVWFEQNPTTINFSTGVDNSLLQTQIDQNNTIIQQNINTYNMQQEELQNINSSIQNQDDQQQLKYETQSTSNSSSINSATADMENQSVTLIQLLTSTIDAIKNSGNSTCNVRIPNNFIYRTSYESINLCPQGYTTFIDTTWSTGFGSFSIRNVFSTVIMIAFLISIVLSILHAIRKLYDMFLGGK